jgi:hypothetical protein
MKGLLALDIDIDALSIQLYNTSSSQTSIELVKNSSNGEEKTNLLMPKELASKTLAKRAAQSRKVFNIKDKF